MHSHCTVQFNRSLYPSNSSSKNIFALSLHLFIDSSYRTHTHSPFTINCDFFSQQASSASVYPSYHDNLGLIWREELWKGEDVTERCSAVVQDCEQTNPFTDTGNYFQFSMKREEPVNLSIRMLQSTVSKSCTEVKEHFHIVLTHISTEQGLIYNPEMSSFSAVLPTETWWDNSQWRQNSCFIIHKTHKAISSLTRPNNNTKAQQDITLCSCFMSGGST